MHQVNRPFVGIPSFLRASVCDDRAKLTHAVAIAVLGVPFDEAAFPPGTPHGTARITRRPRCAFAPRGLLRPGDPPAVPGTGDDRRPDRRHGRYRHPPDQRGTELRADHQRRRRYWRALPVVLGGDHSITYPVVRAFSQPLHVLHFDAHTDYAPFVHGLRNTNGHAFRHVAAMTHVQGLTQIGIRSLRHGREQIEDVFRDGNRIVTMSEFRRLGPAGIVALLPENAARHASIDVDALDMSLVPGCVSAEPNGMSYAELRDFMGAIAERLEVVGLTSSRSIRCWMSAPESPPIWARTR